MRLKFLHLRASNWRVVAYLKSLGELTTARGRPRPRFLMALPFPSAPHFGQAHMPNTWDRPTLPFCRAVPQVHALTCQMQDRVRPFRALLQGLDSFGRRQYLELAFRR